MSSTPVADDPKVPSRTLQHEPVRVQVKRDDGLRWVVNGTAAGDVGAGAVTIKRCQHPRAGTGPI